MAYEDFA
ncbi:hypothetical protein TrRE_jg9903, partial [Triparma retinervis]